MVSELTRALGTKVQIDSTNIPASTVIQADILASSIQGDRLDVFVSAEITGTGSEANTAHSLGHTPTVVIVYLTQKDTTTAFDIVEGTHDATNIKVDCEATAKYKIVAFKTTLFLYYFYCLYLFD